MNEINVIEDIKQVVLTLDKLDKYFDEVSNKQSEIDSKISDLLHYIENNTLKTNECYRIVKEIKKQRKVRRVLKNNYELIRVVRAGYTRLNNDGNRKMLLTDINKTYKQLGTKYTNRVYTKEEMKEILGGKV